MDHGFKSEILRLRNNGMSYAEISKQVGCSKSTVSFHCTNSGLGYIGLGKTQLDRSVINEMMEYRKLHTIQQTASQFMVSPATVKRYCSSKPRIVMSLEDRSKANYARVKARRQRLKELAIEYKGGKCEVCGYSRSIWALEFHHKESSQKDFSVSKYQTLAWSKLKQELDKCMIVCANCHREIHHDEYENNRHVRSPS